MRPSVPCLLARWPTPASRLRLPHTPHTPPPPPQESKDLPAVRKMLDTAQAVLGYDLLALCLEGPKEKLDDTVYAQVGALCTLCALCMCGGWCWCWWWWCVFCVCERGNSQR